MIVDYSDTNLTIERIDVVNDLLGGNPVVLIKPLDGAASAFRAAAPIEFDLRHWAAPTLVDIEKRGTGLITFTGLVNNPIGLTRIINLTQSIVSTGTNPIVTNLLDIAATGTGASIGTSTNRLRVDLVQFIARARVDGPSTDVFRAPRIVATADIDVFLSLRGLDRTTLGGEMLVPIDTITAGRDVDLELRDAVLQAGLIRSGAVTVKVRAEASTWGGVNGVDHSFHFRGPDANGQRDPARTGRSALLDPAVYISTSTPTPIDSRYHFELRNNVLTRTETRIIGSLLMMYRAALIGGEYVLFDTTSLTGVAGIEAGDDIIVADTQGLAADPAAPSASAGVAQPRIGVDGFVDVLGLGHLDVNVDGAVDLEEVAGDLRVGLVRSRADDVILTSRAGSITDAPTGADASATTGDTYADVVGIDITLHTARGAIGSNSNFLEIDSSNRDGAAFDGLLNADALDDIRITETIGTLRVDLVDSKTGDVSLVTLGGSIVDGRNDGNVNVEGNAIDLDANGGSVGDPTGNNDLEIDSARESYGDVGMEASTSIFVTETDGTLHLALAEALGGNVRITVRETSPDLDEDLDLLHSGSVRFVENVLRDVPRGRIAASGSVLLRIGDDMTSTPNSEIRAGTTIDIYGDWTNADAGYGTTIVLRGDIESGGLTRVFGNNDTDVVEFGDPDGVAGGTSPDDPGYIHLGGKTRVYGTAAPTPAGTTASACTTTTSAPYCDEDTFTVYFLQTMDVASGDTLTLDGQDATDTYTVYTSGSRGSSRDYVINVLDSGAPADGVDTLDIYGADSTLNGYQTLTTPYPTDDIFLLRRTTGITGEVADRPAFVALLHTTLDVAAPTGMATTGSFDVERINYDTAINGRLTVLGRGGNDYFASDDNSAITTLDGGQGNDTFQVGQIYGLKRDGSDYVGGSPNTSGVTNGGSLTADDVFGTVATTRGWLSAGNTQSMVAQGGLGDDLFVVYSNQAALRLEGDDGNDQFIVRAFALAATTGDCADVNNSDCQIVWRDVDQPGRDAPPHQRVLDRRRNRHPHRCRTEPGRVQRQRSGVDRGRQRHRQGGRARNRVRRPHRRHRNGDLRRGADGHLLDDRDPGNRRARGRRHLRHPVDGARCGHPGDRGPRQRRDQRRR